MSVCQERLMQVRQPRGNRASISTASDDQHAHSVLKEFGMNLVCFHDFILRLFSRQIPEVFVCCRPGTSQESRSSVLPGLTTTPGIRPDVSSAGPRHWDA